ncbi:LysR family transcriptional regulator [Devosia sp. 2618]|uniref:LysR family transcriptional regulator n=1 Tax=Devosia sp. 2618 TaxID=3156454 RepID=UPI0033964A98
MAFDGRLLNGIGVLAAVVEAGSFVRAGEALGLTQSGVSRAVARLELRVGIKLFHRTARSVVLTEEGRRFFEEVSPLLAGIEDAATEAAGTTSVVRGRLRINVDTAFGSYFLAPRLQPFLARYPDLVVDLAVRDRMGDLVAEGFDVAIRFGEPEPSSLRSHLLLRTRVLTCAAPSYVTAHGAPTHPSELTSGHQCILMRDPSHGGPFGWQFHQGKEVVDVPARGGLMVNDTGALLGACLGGLGIAQPLELYARDYVNDGRLVQLLPDWAEERFPLYMYYRPNDMMPAKMRVFLDFVKDLTRDLN